ncbi:hypothetical protein ABAC460_05205 [Asticcacaulis sp. AC460]|uniref:nucleotidyl transferase AbiEii/AbiGii toxin family protein n=1 Tax=Asticcacaulis sp. AC460 TaxID=1282360 RepID=UPI0003C3F687|nr:nucleotidyl transferase AbiEii/AbiGii toxin family protein [Asticcacaulis sp. AC460]ESQ91739.1 hypothetical protein ABAC460_05205 [Asticcacaulis sp. AC460]
MTTFHPRTHVLPAAQRALWSQLAPLVEMGFVLYGGTAVALRLGHRVSVDFDFFHDQPLDGSRLRQACAFLTEARVLQDQPDNLTVLVPGEAWVKVSFLAPIRFGRVSAPEKTADGTLVVASAEDLLATKLKVILQRAEAKDYRDISAMLSAGTDLAHGLAAASTLFAPTFQPSESLKALTFFGEGDLGDLEPAVRHVLIDQARRVGPLPEVAIVSRKLAL